MSNTCTETGWGKEVRGKKGGREEVRERGKGMRRDERKKKREKHATLFFSTIILLFHFFLH